MNKNFDMENLKKDANYIFNNGFACSESVIYALNKNLELGMSDDAIAMSSGFPWGLGGAGCLCGAVAGGAMCLGQVFGRRVPHDSCIEKCFVVTQEYHDAFKKEFGANCCGKLIENYDKNQPERKAYCGKLVEFAVVKVAEIILKESK